MSKKIKLIMPKMGESVVEATILSWLKKPGERIAQDESVLEVATDKVDTEIPTTHAGILEKILVKEGEIVKVGSPIAVISSEFPQNNFSSEKTALVEPDTPFSKADKPDTIPNSIGSDLTNSMRSLSRFYSPLVKTIAKKENIPAAELASIAGTGSGGRVTKKDMLAYLRQRNTKSVASPSSLLSDTLSSIASEYDEIIQMDRMRKIIATRMVESKRIAPHVTSFVEADVTNLVKWKDRNKSAFMHREQESLTYTPVFVEAIANALRDFPMLNIQVEQDRIIKKKNINIGIAVALPSGNLIVPVVKHADRYSLAGLVKKVNHLVRMARKNKLNPDDLSEGTFTLSNVGSVGSVMGTPIIMQPQVGIIATGIIQKKPAVIETSDGDTLGIRHKLFLSHSYDHRVVDGALGGMFVRKVADYLEKFDVTKTL